MAAPAAKQNDGTNSVATVKHHIAYSMYRDMLGTETGGSDAPPPPPPMPAPITAGGPPPPPPPPMPTGIPAVRLGSEVSIIY
ncbi:hypothetical protein B566_EDAN011857 [Ephemera danica]|nr:hypothetical protein B566_EDAN011857 [Ephemera danica]